MKLNTLKLPVSYSALAKFDQGTEGKNLTENKVVWTLTSHVEIEVALLQIWMSNIW